MTLYLQIPPNYQSERCYIIQVLLGEFLGLKYQIEIQSRQDIRITADGGRELILADVLFKTPRDQWLTKASLPKLPLPIWNIRETSLDCPLVSPQLPIICGLAQNHTVSGSDPFIDIISLPNTLILNIDIFGSTFFMLTRYEEVVTPDEDQHGRFPAKASLAYHEGFLDRPIVNEYLEILWWCLKRLWPGLKRKRREFRIIPSHDVDCPFKSVSNRQLQEVRQILLRKKLPLVLKRLLQRSEVLTRGRPDPFDTFGWLMDKAEERGVKSAFYLKANVKRRKHDPHYRLDHPLLKERIKMILDRGHEIGFHPGYYTAENREEWIKEWRLLKSCLPHVNIKGGRQHFLKFRVPLTWRFWKEAGLQYDSSLSFADRAGFRCGTCYEYPVFDLSDAKTLKLCERPLLVMDKTLLLSHYMSLRREQAEDYLNKLKRVVRLFNGDFTFLWHNSYLSNQENKQLYETLIQ